MWECSLCEVRFSGESYENHILSNHLSQFLTSCSLSEKTTTLPAPLDGANVATKSSTAVAEVFTCGNCHFTAGCFEAIAQHCSAFHHDPCQVRKGQDFDDYISYLFLGLNAIINGRRKTKSLPTTIVANDAPGTGVDHSATDHDTTKVIFKPATNHPPHQSTTLVAPVHYDPAAGNRRRQHSNAPVPHGPAAVNRRRRQHSADAMKQSDEPSKQQQLHQQSSTSLSMKKDKTAAAATAAVKRPNVQPAAGPPLEIEMGGPPPSKKVSAIINNKQKKKTISSKRPAAAAAITVGTGTADRNGGTNNGSGGNVHECPQCGITFSIPSRLAKHLEDFHSSSEPSLLDGGPQFNQPPLPLQSSVTVDPQVQTLVKEEEEEQQQLSTAALKPAAAAAAADIQQHEDNIAEKHEIEAYEDEDEGEECVEEDDIVVGDADDDEEEEMEDEDLERTEGEDSGSRNKPPTSGGGPTTDDVIQQLIDGVRPMSDSGVKTEPTDHQPTEQAEVTSNLLDSTAYIENSFIQQLEGEAAAKNNDGTPGQAGNVLSWNEPHPCSHCDKTLANRYGLQRHLTVIHGLKDVQGLLRSPAETKEKQIYPCPMCTAKFTQPYNISRHVRNVHKTEPAPDLLAKVLDAAAAAKASGSESTGGVLNATIASNTTAEKALLDNADPHNTAMNETINAGDHGGYVAGDHGDYAAGDHGGYAAGDHAADADSSAALMNSSTLSAVYDNNNNNTAATTTAQIQQYPCHLCGKMLSRKDKLTSHMRRMHNGSNDNNKNEGMDDGGGEGGGAGDENDKIVADN